MSDNVTIQSLSREKDPCKQLVTKYASKDDGMDEKYTLGFLIDIVCNHPKGLQRKDIKCKISDWFDREGVRNWISGTNGWVNGTGVNVSIM